MGKIVMVISRQSPLEEGGIEGETPVLVLDVLPDIQFSL